MFSQKTEGSTARLEQVELARQENRRAETPSVFSLFQSLAKSRTDRGVGADAVPSDVYKHFDLFLYWYCCVFFAHCTQDSWVSLRVGVLCLQLVPQR